MTVVTHKPRHAELTKVTWIALACGQKGPLFSFRIVAAVDVGKKKNKEEEEEEERAACLQGGLE